MTKRVNNEAVPVEPVSIRLHKPTLDRLDKIAERTRSNRTDIIRRALATYFRLGSAILVPVSPQTRRCLVDLADRKQLAAEALAEQLLNDAVAKAFRTEVETFQQHFSQRIDRAGRKPMKVDHEEITTYAQ